MKKKQRKFEYSLLLLLASLVSIALQWHTFYASTATVKPTDHGTIGIKLKVFTDDLALAIGTQKLTDTANDQMAVKQYLAKHFQLVINGQIHPWKWQSVNIDNERVQAYWEVPVKPTAVKEMKISNSIIVDAIDQQVNIVRLYLQEDKKVFNFNSQIQEEAIRYP